MFLEIYLRQYHRFSFIKICYFQQSLFTETITQYVQEDMTVYSSTPVF